MGMCYITFRRRNFCLADLLLRQYKRVRDERKKQFSYKDICPVYTIVFLENSPSEFWKYPDRFVHAFSSESDTGLKLNMLQNVIFIPVDIFMEKLHNKDKIETEFEAWLTFLGCDEPEYIIKLIDQYPYFKPLYGDLYNMCLNVERVINMFSEELKILDQNTVKYMIDELQEQLDSANETIADRDATIAKLQAELDALKKEK